MDVEGAWPAFAIGAMVCLGLSDLLNKRAMRAKVRRTQFLVVQSVFFTITTLFLVPLVGGFEWSPQLVYAVACGVITFFSYVLVLKALETGEATVAVPIYRMSFAVTVVLAVALLDEELTTRKVMGFALIVLALVALTAMKSRRRGKGSYHSSEGLPIGRSDVARSTIVVTAAFAVMAMFTIGTKGFFYKVGVSGGAPPATFALVQSITFLPIAVVYALAMDRSVTVDRMTLSHAPYNGVLTALASVLLLLALVGGEASTAVPISQLCFVVTAVLAVMVFRERMTWVKGLGIASAVLAVVVLSSAWNPL